MVDVVLGTEVVVVVVGRVVVVVVEGTLLVVVDDSTFDLFAVVEVGVFLGDPQLAKVRVNVVTIAAWIIDLFIGLCPFSLHEPNIP